MERSHKLTMRQRMIDVLVEIAESDTLHAKQRIEAASTALSYLSFGPPPGGYLDDPAKEQSPDPPCSVTIGDVYADPFPWPDILGEQAPAGEAPEVDSVTTGWFDFCGPTPKRFRIEDGVLTLGDYESAQVKPAPKVEVEEHSPCGGKSAGLSESGTQYTVRLDGVVVGSFCSCSRILNPSLKPQSELIRATIEHVIKRVTA